MSRQHVYPVNDLIEHEDSDDCICGPDLEFVSGGVVILHHSLDGREALEVERECACSKCTEKVRRSAWTYPYCIQCYANPDCK